MDFHETWIRVGKKDAMELGGILHVAAVTGNASGNIAFHTAALGMRLVKNGHRLRKISGRM